MSHDTLFIFKVLRQQADLALAWSAMLWFDTCIFALTFWKAIQVRREVAGGLLVTIFRDGMSTYVAILIRHADDITVLRNRVLCVRLT